VPAVADISLTIPAGSVIGLVGANGAGKTTTLGAIAATRSVAAGEIVFDGRSIVGLTPEKIVRAGIALVPENRRIFGSLSVIENLLLGVSVGHARAPAGDVLAETLDRFPILKTNLKKSAGMLSGGQQQQLAIARALVTKPKLLMLDEPSLGLAPRVVDFVFELLAELKEDGQTILLVEQNVRRTLRFADRSYILRGGTVSFQGSRDEFEAIDAAVVEDAFFGHGEASARATQRVNSGL
jgi:branched-chain amino acid transport system ATP-binding protein